MRIIVLTSSTHGIASKVLPELCSNENIDVAKVVLAHAGSPNRKKHLTRKVKKTLKIGLLGALNGIRMRGWYAEPDIPDIRSLCESLNVELSDTPHISCDTTKNLFIEADADLGLSLGNSYIPKSVFSIPKHGMLNIHTELLPAFQGAQSIIWPIFEGIEETGFTIHQINLKIDAGDILLQKQFAIQFFPTLKETVQENLRRVRADIPKAFSEVCDHYLELKAKAKPQGRGKSYTTPSIFQFYRMIRNHRAMYKQSLRRR